jgi:hypothetical protein
MSNNLLGKIILIMIYLIIIIMIPLFLDILFKLTVRKNRKSKIKNMAQKKSIETNKSLIIFNDRYNGIVINPTNPKIIEEFTGDIVEIVNQMADNSCVIVVSETLEYIGETKTDKSRDSLLSKTIKQLKNISGNDFYCINIEKNSPRVLWDYKIKNIMDKSFYLPGDVVEWHQPNELQIKIQKFYFYVFKILPYHFFAYDPVIKNKS